MKALLFICHGSRIKASSEEALRFIDECRPLLSGIPIVEHCFLELSAPNIAEGFKKCIEQGATHVAVLPFLLLTAAHYKHDIPAELSEIQAVYPELQITYGEPIGVSNSMSELLLEKAYAANADQDTEILLVGRGSSMLEVKEQLREIASPLCRKYPHVTLCYLAACGPTFEEAFDQAMASGRRSILILPYLLFTGILTRTIERHIKRAADSGKEVQIAGTLGSHPQVKAALLERVKAII